MLHEGFVGSIPIFLFKVDGGFSVSTVDLRLTNKRFRLFVLVVSSLLILS